MLIIYSIFFLIFFFSGLVSFCMKSKHLLSTLLSLEFMVLSIYLYMIFFLVLNFFDCYFIIYFLVFSVCEGALGLSILVSMIRSHGVDYFSSFNLVQC